MNAPSTREPLTVNGRSYAWPDAPLVIVCIDGSEPDYEGSDGGGYMERAMAAGAMPWLAAALEHGTRRLADCVVPTFTNPNNLSIVTGVPPAVHGICGNFFYDRERDEVSYGRVPAGSVVVPGSLPSEDGRYALSCAVIVKRVDERTRAKVGINALLRDAGD